MGSLPGVLRGLYGACAVLMSGTLGCVSVLGRFGRQMAKSKVDVEQL